MTCVRRLRLISCEYTRITRELKCGKRKKMEENYDGLFVCNVELGLLLGDLRAKIWEKRNCPYNLLKVLYTISI